MLMTLPQIVSPKISVVMAVYNSEPFLRQALASIRWQTFSEWECICINDGSTDNSGNILHDFAAVDSRFRVVSQPNKGIVAALNRGDALARADWIARMDSDDVALPERLDQQWKFVQSHPDIVALGARVQLVDPEGSPLAVARYVTDHDDLDRHLHGGDGTSFAHPTMLMSRDAIFAAGQYREEYRWAHDCDLMLRLSRLGRLANLPQVLLLYRQHEKSFCATRREQIRSDLRRLLAETRIERGMSTPAAIDQQLVARRYRTSMLSKWARQAARAGYFRTAFKHWRRQVWREPYSLLTARTTAEMVLRCGEALVLRSRREAPPTLPDWHPFDCRPRQAA